MLFKQLTRGFWLMLLAGFVVRLVAALLAPHPGIGDPTHYYNLASNLAEGRGFVIDYIWQYHNPPPDITHPIDYWMPLPALWPAIGLTFAPGNLFAALAPSVVLGTLVIALAYAVASVAGAPERVRLLSMAGVVFLPEFVLNSARTDTTISYILFAGCAMLCFYLGLRRRSRWLLLAGVFAGLTQLSRQDGVILAPAMVLALIVYWRFGNRPLPWRWLILIPVGWLGVMAPWLLRNLSVLGVVLPGGASRTLFMTSFIDQFTYGRTLDLQHYLDWGVGNILSMYVVQALANLKVTVTLLDALLPVTALLGLGGLLLKRDRERLLLFALPMSMALGLFVFYSFVTPFHGQGGSFKKSYMLLIPFLSFAGAWALAEYLRPKGAVLAAAGLMMALMLFNAFELVRADFDLAGRYDVSLHNVANRLNSLPDVNDDGEIIVMTQDPFMLNYVGFRALMLPSDPRDMILEAARRYNVDYIMLPAAREGLDPLYDGREVDFRLPVAGSVEIFKFLAVAP